jgi:excisionase family DNA binding protein
MAATLLTTQEMAERLRRSKYQVYQDVKAGRIPAVRIHPKGRLLFNADEVERALHRSGSDASTSAPA